MIARRTLLFPFASGRARHEARAESRPVLSAITVKRNVMACRWKVDKTELALLPQSRSTIAIENRFEIPFANPRGEWLSREIMGSTIFYFG